MKRSAPLARGQFRPAPVAADGTPRYSTFPRRTHGLPRTPLAVVGSGGAQTRPQRRKDTGPSPAVRRLVLERDGCCCVCCGRSIIGQRYSLGHRLRASQGGKAVPENLLTFLGWGGEACHGRIDLYRDPADEAKGYRIHSGVGPEHDPLWVPVTLFNGRQVWLTPAGRYAYEPPEDGAA